MLFVGLVIFLGYFSNKNVRSFTTKNAPSQLFCIDFGTTLARKIVSI